MTDHLPDAQDDFSLDNLIAWLDAKYARHKELEDHYAANALRELKALLELCERQRKALKRLSSPEAFLMSRALDQDRDAELIARMRFAEAACSPPGAPG